MYLLCGAACEYAAEEGRIKRLEGDTFKAAVLPHIYWEGAPTCGCCLWRRRYRYITPKTSRTLFIYFFGETSRRRNRRRFLYLKFQTGKRVLFPCSHPDGNPRRPGRNFRKERDAFPNSSPGSRRDEGSYKTDKRDDGYRYRPWIRNAGATNVVQTALHSIYPCILSLQGQIATTKRLESIFESQRSHVQPWSDGAGYLNFIQDRRNNLHLRPDGLSSPSNPFRGQHAACCVFAGWSGLRVYNPFVRQRRRVVEDGGGQTRTLTPCRWGPSLYFDRQAW